MACASSRSNVPACGARTDPRPRARAIRPSSARDSNGRTSVRQRTQWCGYVGRALMVRCGIGRQYTRADTERSKTAAETLPDVLQFMRLLWALVHGLNKTSKRMTAEIGVTGPQRLVLRVAGLFPGLSAGDLARLLHVHPSTLTGVLRRLVAQRLLTRTNDPRDHRRAVLTLSALGAKINSDRRGTVEEAIQSALRSVPPRDRAATKRVLERLTAQLETGRRHHSR
jgi:MarR family transcriptional regulator, organic hydroperoxide resistance regulator